MEIMLNEQNFEEEVLKSELPVLVDFYADWCGPCKMMAPAVAKLADVLEGKAKVAKLNVDEAQEIAMKYGVMSIPTFIVFKNGEPVNKKMGAMAPKELQSIMDGIL